MNSSYACVGIIVKSNIGEPFLLNFSNEVSDRALGCNLGLAEVYYGNANKKRVI